MGVSQGNEPATISNTESNLNHAYYRKERFERKMPRKIRLEETGYSHNIRVSEKNKCAGLRRILVRMQGVSASAY